MSKQAKNDRAPKPSGLALAKAGAPRHIKAEAFNGGTLASVRKAIRLHVADMAGCGFSAADCREELHRLERAALANAWSTF